MRKMKNRPLKRATSIALAIALVMGTVLDFGLTPSPKTYAEYGQSADEPLYGDVFAKLADPETSNAVFPPATLENGRLWTDKTVSRDKASVYDNAGNPTDVVNANADEFLVTLSALGQSFSVDTLVEPTDTVFILDVSASMYMNKLDNGKSRIETLVLALNGAIKTLIDGNPYNRFAVVAYGGDSGNSKIYPILKLDHHEVSGGEYFSMRSAAYVQVNAQIPDSALIDPANHAVRVNGGTPTQRGLYAGAKVLLENTDTDFTADYNGQPVTVTRKPNIVLMTDGGPTLGWTDYRFENPDSDNDDKADCGNANNTDMGIDLLTVLTASHMKQLVQSHYYGGDNDKSVGFYTIGLDVDSTHAPATMNPYGVSAAGKAGVNAEQIKQSYSGTVYNMKTLLDSFAAGEGITFPALVKGESSLRSLRTVQNADGFVKTCDYTDKYYFASDADGLSGAFSEIARKLVSHGSYSTKVNLGDPPDFGGYLIFSDVIGEYMEVKDVKGLWYENTRYDGHNFARDIANNQGTARSDFVRVLYEFQHEGMGYGFTQAQAESLLSSCLAAGKAGGGLYYDSDGDFSNKVTYYADAQSRYIGDFFTQSGEQSPPPAEAKCVAELYTVRGAAVNSVTGENSDLTDISFQVITALGGGNFDCVLPNGYTLPRELKKDGQIVRWYVPASLIPLRTVKPVFGAGTTAVGMQIAEAAPVRVIYSVGLREEFTLSDADGDDYKYDNGAGNGAYYFYTNQWLNAKNFSTAFFEPSDDNPYYYYTSQEADNSGKIPLYTDKNGTAADGYTSGAVYYTKTLCFDYNLADSGYLKTEYIPVDETVTEISGKGAVPYIEAGQIKRMQNDGALKTDNTTETMDYSFMNSFLSNQSGERIQIHYLMNNGRLTVPFTSVKVIKEWDKDLGALIKPEYVQLYGNDEPAGEPVLLGDSALFAAAALADEDPVAEYTFGELPVYALKADGGNAVFIQYTVAEGTWAGGVFTPYGGDNADFIVNYCQPRWNTADSAWEDAQISNINISDPQRLIIIEKTFEGLDPFTEFADGKTITFELYEDDGSGFVPMSPPTARYPDDFTNGRLVLVSESTASRYKIKETAHADGSKFNWELLADGYAVTKESDGYSLIVNAENQETVLVEMLNKYTPANPPKLTLRKEYGGSIKAGDIHDITFILEGWEDDTKTKQTVSESVDLSTEQSLILPTGYYTVTEYGAEDASKADDPIAHIHDFALTATVNGNASGLDLTGGNEIGFWLKDGDVSEVVMTNTYKQRAALIIEKKLEGLEDGTIPDYIIFNVAEDGGGFSRNIGYSMFTEGKYVITDLPPANYTVTETEGGIVDGYNTPTVTVSNASVKLEYDGADQTVSFTNQYTPAEQQTTDTSTDTSAEISTDFSTDTTAGTDTDISTEISTDISTDISTETSTDVSTATSADNSTATSVSKETTDSKSTETTALKSTETTALKSTETTAFKSTETTASKSAETTVSKSTETTVSKSTETTVSKSTETTVSKSTETTVSKSTETTVSKSTETTVVSKSTETTAPKSTETTAPKSTETTAPKSTETTDSKSTETSTSKSTSTSTSTATSTAKSTTTSAETTTVAESSAATSTPNSATTSKAASSATATATSKSSSATTAKSSVAATVNSPNATTVPATAATALSAATSPPTTVKPFSSTSAPTETTTAESTHGRFKSPVGHHNSTFGGTGGNSGSSGGYGNSAGNSGNFGTGAGNTTSTQGQQSGTSRPPNTGYNGNLLLRLWICGASLTVFSGAVLVGKRAGNRGRNPDSPNSPNRGDKWKI